MWSSPHWRLSTGFGDAVRRPNAADQRGHLLQPVRHRAIAVAGYAFRGTAAGTGGTVPRVNATRTLATLGLSLAWPKRT